MIVNGKPIFQILNAEDGKACSVSLTFDDVVSIFRKMTPEQREQIKLLLNEKND